MSRILIVDDNADNRYLLQVLVAGLGHDALVAGDGVEALAAARATPPDLVVSDILMPRMDGWALCREWRADLALRSIPFVFYTATYTEPKDESFALALGADRFLVKPQEPEVLIKLIQELLASGRADVDSVPSETNKSADIVAELGFVKLHRDAVIRKLEDKMAELQATNAALRRDVAERLRAESALRKSEARFHLLAEVSPVGIFQTDAHGSTTYVNRRWTEISGMPAGDALGDGWLRGVHPDDREQVVAGWTEAFGAGRSSGGDYRFVRPDGAVVWVIGQAVAVRDEAGDVVGYVGTTTDITDRMRVEEALRESEARYRSLFEQAPVGIYRTTPEGSIVLANPTLVAMLGYANAKELQGLNLEVAGFGPDTPRARFKEALARDGHVNGLESQWSRKDGTPLVVRESAHAVLGDDGRVLYYEGAVEDVSERAQAESALRRLTAEEEALRQQLTHAQKLEAVGRLAGGIAHDFNNVLQALLSQIAVLGLRLRGVPGAHKPIEEMDQLVRRGAALTRQLLLFSRREAPARVPADLNDLVRGASTLVRRVVREDVAIATELGKGPLPVMADHSQCDQVLMNLVVNASDAMPAGGTLTLRTGGDDATVWLSVTDTGCGISDDAREHLFEPFFTTKPVGKGTGLGLSVVHGIMTAHGGSVSVSSREGAGTTFTVTLPRLLDSPLRAEPGGEEAVDVTGRGERLLLVEDEDGARQGLLEILGSLGYAVTAAASGEEALALPASPPFDLLLTDFVLPGVAGPELASRLRERWPRLRVAVMSGYAEVDVLHRARTEIGVEFLQKPFHIAELARAIRRALGS